MQVTRHPPRQGEPYLLRRVRVLRFKTFRQRDQDRFPGAGWKEKQKQDRLKDRVPRLVYAVCIGLDTALYHMHAVYTIEVTCIALAPVHATELSRFNPTVLQLALAYVLCPLS